jgi:hypothetical protein
MNTGNGNDKCFIHLKSWAKVNNNRKLANQTLIFSPLFICEREGEHSNLQSFAKAIIFFEPRRHEEHEERRRKKRKKIANSALIVR